jgi:hypothetical protein
MLIGWIVVHFCLLSDTMHSLADVQLNNHIVNCRNHSQMPLTVYYSVVEFVNVKEFVLFLLYFDQTAVLIGRY